MPSTADRIEIAGVMTASPYSSAVAASAAAPIQRSAGECGATRCTKASSAKLPPSPRLSARIVTKTYLTVTTRINAHTSIDSTPRTWKESRGNRCCPIKLSRKA